MKKYVVAVFVVLFTLPMFSQNKFVGIKSCVCHKLAKQGKQVTIWEKTKHAEAYNVLKSDKAAEFMKAKDLKGAATDAKECLECHTTGYGEPQEKSFDMTMGVQCEACHGAASGYKLIHNKPDKLDQAIKAGLIINKKEDGTSCKKCHNPKMHPMKDFDFKKMWGEIEHPLPKG